jgi:hypothetical protein
MDINWGQFAIKHKTAWIAVVLIESLAVLFVLLGVTRIKKGHCINITKAANKTGDMFTYSIPYVLTASKFDFADTGMLTSISVFLFFMFCIAYRTQSFFVNPVLTLAGYSLLDCQYKEGGKDKQAFMISKFEFHGGDVCVVQKLSPYLYIVTEVKSEG